jgi:hypothetical protein
MTEEPQISSSTSTTPSARSIDFASINAHNRRCESADNMNDELPHAVNHDLDQWLEYGRDDFIRALGSSPSTVSIGSQPLDPNVSARLSYIFDEELGMARYERKLCLAIMKHIGFWPRGYKGVRWEVTRLRQCGEAATSDVPKWL